MNKSIGVLTRSSFAASFPSPFYAGEVFLLENLFENANGCWELSVLGVAEFCIYDSQAVGPKCLVPSSCSVEK